MPKKCGDPGVFSIPIAFGDSNTYSAMLDLGASINVLPQSLYESFNLGPLKETRVVIQLADKSTAYPLGKVEDVLVRVGELIFPADFYVLDMGTGDHKSSILLGRPFMKTADTKIEVMNGSLTMEFDGKVERFDVSNSEKPQASVRAVSAIDVLEPDPPIDTTTGIDKPVKEVRKEVPKVTPKVKEKPKPRNVKVRVKDSGQEFEKRKGVIKRVGKAMCLVVYHRLDVGD